MSKLPSENKKILKLHYAWRPKLENGPRPHFGRHISLNSQPAHTLKTACTHLPLVGWAGSPTFDSPWPLSSAQGTASSYLGQRSSSPPDRQSGPSPAPANPWGIGSRGWTRRCRWSLSSLCNAVEILGEAQWRPAADVTTHPGKYCTIA
jgi:hypothetical protein